MNEASKNAVEELIAKAASDHDANNAMKFSQAAANAANALCALKAAETDPTFRPKS